MADPVGDVAEEELLAPGHAGVANDQDVDVVLLGGVHDREGRIVVDHDVRAASLAGEAGGVQLQLVGRGSSPGDLGRAVLGVGGVEGDHDLDDVQLRGVGVRECGRPLDGPLRGGGTIGTHHDAGDAFRSAAPVA